MLDEIRSVFRKTWESFVGELGRREPEDEVAELLSLMRREMVAARAALPEYDAVARRIGAELESERRSLEDTRRRRDLADRIRDAETVRIANEFIARHEAHTEVLEQKLAAARSERELRGREVEEMSRRYKEADANRFGLLAQLRSQRARQRMRSALDGDLGPFDEFSRMEETIHDQAGYADVLEEMADAERSSGSAPPNSPDPVDVEERLRELKRRLGRHD